MAHLDSMDELGATSPRVETKRTLMFHHVRQHGRGLPGVPRYTDDLQPIGSTYVIYMNTTKDPTVHVARYTIHLKISSNFRSKRNPGLLAKMVWYSGALLRKSWTLSSVFFPESWWDSSKLWPVNLPPPNITPQKIRPYYIRGLLIIGFPWFPLIREGRLTSHE